MEQNPYKAPQHYAERRKQPWTFPSAVVPIVLALGGLGQLLEGGRLSDVVRAGAGIFLMASALVLYQAQQKVSNTN